MVMKALHRWLLRDYLNDLREIDSNIVARFARGNVLMQKKRFLSKREANDLSMRGDKALARIRKFVS